MAPKNEIPKIATRDGAVEIDAFGRFRDTATASRLANGPESRASLALIRYNRRRLDCLADDAVGFQPVSGFTFLPLLRCGGLFSATAPAAQQVEIIRGIN